MQLTILYFAGLRDLVARPEEVIEVTSEQQVKDVLLLLQKLHPHLQLVGVRVAVNEEFVQVDHPLQSGDTLALIPPVSGG